jgi:hypothetical protein
VTNPNLAKLLAKPWPYSTADPAAYAEISSRVARVGKRRELINYSRLTSGLELRIESVGGSVPFELGVPDWTDLDRSILGDLLGRLSLESYQRGAFLASALVTSKGTQEPGEGFWNFVAELGVLSSTSPTRRLLFWSDQVRIAHDWYAANDW